MKFGISANEIWYFCHLISPPVLVPGTSISHMLEFNILRSVDTFSFNIRYVHF